jgi:glycosyltransferase involved in cell wall biosynthesis
MGSAQADPRLVVVGGYPPNEAFGGGLVLKGLLSSYPSDRLAVVTSGSVLRALQEKHHGGGLLPARHVSVDPWQSRFPGLRRLLRVLNLFQVVTATRRIVALTDNDTVLLALPWGGELGSEIFAAAFFAHRITGAPLVLYELDEWRASVAGAGRSARLLEALLHGPMARSASSVWVMSAPLARTLADRFGIRARVMPHSVDLDRFPRNGAEPPRTGEFTLLYAGAIYAAQADAIANLVRAMNTAAMPCRLILHTPESPAALAGFGIAGERVSVEPLVPSREIPALLAGADALLLPFSFSEEERDVVSTSFPTKTADYLASGVPILVHAPPYATISRLAQEEGWGLTVTDPSSSALAKAIESLARDGDLRRRLVTRARAIAAERHDLARRRVEFRDSIRTASASQPRA